MDIIASIDSVSHGREWRSNGEDKRGNGPYENK